MAAHSNGGPAELLVLHRGTPAPSSADPRARQAFRRSSLIARLTGLRVEVLGLEPLPGTAANPLTGAALDERVRAARAVWVTDFASARAVLGALARTAHELPIVLELESLPSEEALAAAALPSARNTDGAQHVVEVRRAAERAILDAAAVVATTGRQLAELIQAAFPTVSPSVVAPCVTPRTEDRRFDQRAGAMHYGRWVSEEGHPDEDGLHRLLDALDTRTSLVTTALAQDAPPYRRAALVDRIDVVDPAEWARALRSARAVVLPRRFGLATPATVAEVVAAGVPFLASPAAVAGLELGPARIPSVVDDEADWPARLEALLATPRSWREHAASLDALAGEWLDGSRLAAETAALLTAAGLDVVSDAADLPPSGGAKPSPVRPAGTTRGADDLHAFEARLLRRNLYTRAESVGTQGHLSQDEGYRLWTAAHDDTSEHLERLRRRGAAFAYRPTISIVVPTYQSDPGHLSEALDSVRDQTWPHWQLCIADDASPDPGVRSVIGRYVEADPRISAVFLDDNRGIAGATNAALELATGDFVGFLDHDDVLRPSALHWIVDLLQDRRDLDVVYTDEDRLDPVGRLAWPSFKPDWSPDLLLAVNYMSHFTVIRRPLVEEVGGLRAGFDGSQDYDLLLRVTERTERIGHVAKPLYSWRQTERSTSTASAAKPEAHDAGRRALREALERRGIEATVRPGFVPTWHDVRYPAPRDVLVSALIPTRDRADLLRTCVEHLRATRHGHRLEIVVIDNDSREPETLSFLDELDRAPDARVVRYPERFNYARQMNLGAAAASGELLLLLNNDARPRTPDWLEVLIGHGLRPEVGVVGARLVFPDGSPQHEGIVVNVADAVAWNVRATGLPTLVRNTRNTTAVTGACLLARRTVYEAVGGLDEQLRVAFNDVDFCRRVSELGYRVIYTPWAELEHAESASRGLLHPDDDEAFYVRRWGGPDGRRDPFYSASLDMAEPVPRFRI
jgi:GT2 family glycosyltransferase